MHGWDRHTTLYRPLMPAVIKAFTMTWTIITLGMKFDTEFPFIVIIADLRVLIIIHPSHPIG